MLNPKIENNLHEGINTAQNYKEMLAFLTIEREKDPKEFTKKLGQYSSSGKLPVDLFPTFDDETNKKETLQFIMDNQPCKKKPLQTPVSWKKVLEKYKPEPDSGLYRNLQVGCEVANAVRKKIWQSSTWPGHNGVPKSKFNHLRRNILYDRLNIEREMYLYILNCPDITFKRKSTDDYIQLHTPLNRSQMIDLAHIQIYYLLKYKRGNCTEYTDYTQYLFLTKTDIHAGQFRIINGDHNFNIIGNSESPDELVVVDSWAGKVYPASLMHKKLRNHAVHNTGENICYSTPRFSQDWHGLEPFENVGRFSLNVIIELTEDNAELRNFILKLVPHVLNDNKKLYLLIRYIEYLLDDFLKYNIITFEDLKNLKNPLSILDIIQNQEQFTSLLYGQSSLADFETAPATSNQHTILSSTFRK